MSENNKWPLLFFPELAEKNNHNKNTNVRIYFKYLSGRHVGHTVCPCETQQGNQCLAAATLKEMQLQFRKKNVIG